MTSESYTPYGKNDLKRQEILLTTRDSVSNFLSKFPDPDEPIAWTCPECHSINPTLHFAYDTPCVCGKFCFPAIPLPIVGSANENMARAYIKEMIKTLKKDIKEAEFEIESLENEIEEKERYIKDSKKEIETLQEDLDRVKREFIEVRITK